MAEYDHHRDLKCVGTETVGEIPPVTALEQRLLGTKWTWHEDQNTTVLFEPGFSATMLAPEGKKVGMPWHEVAENRIEGKSATGRFVLTFDPSFETGSITTDKGETRETHLLGVSTTAGIPVSRGAMAPPAALFGTKVPAGGGAIPVIQLEPLPGGR